MNLLEALTQMLAPQAPAAPVAPAPLPVVPPMSPDPEQQRLKSLGVKGEMAEMRRLGPRWARQEHQMDAQALDRLLRPPPATGALPAGPETAQPGYGAMPKKVGL